MTGFVLLSSSPRRKALLAAVGLFPPVDPPDVDESVRAGEAPIAYALRVAASKARAKPHPVPVLAADTVVAIDGASLGKPESKSEARDMLLVLAGRTHAVHTAVVVLEPSGRAHSEVITSYVRFRAASAVEIDRYVATGEPIGKAGAYAIQGEGGALVAHVEGSYSNIIGLPLEETLRLLALAGAS